MSYGREQESVARWGSSWLRIVLPDLCLACGEPTDIDQSKISPAPGLCPPCAGRLTPPPRTPCTGCGRTLHGQVSTPARCGRCRQRPPAWDQFLWAWSYQPPLDAVIAGLKFRRLDYLGPKLGRHLGRKLQDILPPVDAVVPVPLHWARKLTRGYDQAELIAAGLATTLQLPLTKALKRRRRTPAQSRHDLPERRRNLRNAFAAKANRSVKNALLVDDVFTTGATLEAAAQALHRAGTRTIVAVTVARTPHPQELGVAG